MKKEIFKQLLEDLFKIYNTSKIKDSDRISNSYSGNEFDAIKTILIKYNHRGHPSYNQNADRDEYVNYVINQYKEGNFVLSQQYLNNQTSQEELKRIQEEEELKRKKEEEKEEIEKVGNKVKENLEQIISEVTNKINLEFNSKKQEMDKQLDYIKNAYQTIKEEEEEKSETNPTKHFTKISIEKINFGENEVILPKEKVLENLCKGDRMIVKTNEGRVCGIEVFEITYDFISYEEEVVKEISLKKI
jgi:vacuolar-type H+-ATPase subunit I/STV1